MPSQAQIDANRRNALHSTGPRTPGGKTQSSRNALKHGLASISPHAFLGIEDHSAFERLLLSYVLKYQPNHADEVDLLTDAVFCKWRQQRLWTLESQAIEIDVATHQRDLQTKLPKANAPAHVAHAVNYSLDHSSAPALNRRYEAQLHRQYLRNLKELQALQSTRVGDESTLDLLYPNEPNPGPSKTSSPNEPNSPSAPSHPVPDRQPGCKTPLQPPMPIGG